MNNFERVIQEKLYETCLHQHARETKYICNEVITILENVLTSKRSIPENTVFKFMEYVTFRYGHHDEGTDNCLFSNEEKILNVLKKIATKQVFGKTSITLITSTERFSELYPYLKEQYTISFFENIIAKQLKFADISLNNGYYDYSTVDLVLSQLEMSKNFKILCYTRVEKISQKVSQYLEKL